MGCLSVEMRFIQSNQGIDLLIDIKILNETLSEEIIEVFQAHTDILDMLLSDHWLSVLDKD